YPRIERKFRSFRSRTGRTLPRGKEPNRFRRARMPFRGYTLWELLVALAVAAIVLGLGVPALERLRLDIERTAAVNAFVGAVQLARSEAAKRARPVVLCKTVDFERCGGDEIRYDDGYMVFVNEDDVRPPRRSAGEPLIRAYRPSERGFPRIGNYSSFGRFVLAARPARSPSVIAAAKSPRARAS